MKKLHDILDVVRECEGENKGREENRRDAQAA